MTAVAITGALNAIQALIRWITLRGITRNRVQEMLDAKADGDFTTDEVQAELDITEDELDDTEDMIDEDENSG